MNLAIAIILVTFASTPAAAQSGATIGSGKVKEYPYPAEPQYQYPFTDSSRRSRVKCPAGQALYQGKCRVVRRVD